MTTNNDIGHVILSEISIEIGGSIIDFKTLCNRSGTSPLEIEMFIENWQSEQEDGKLPSFKQFFQRSGLSRAPYRLRYSVDHSRPSLALLHPTLQSDISLKLVQECNGIILDSESLAIVAHGMDTLHAQVSLGDFETLEKRQESGQVTVEESEDGSVIRVFRHNNEWIIATNRRIDARQARWSSAKTFHQMFCEALPAGATSLETLLNDALDPDYTYSFILLHPANQLVTYHPIPQLVSAGRRHNTTQIEEAARTFPCTLSVPPSHKTWEDFRHMYQAQATGTAALVSGNLCKRGLIVSDWTDPVHVKRWKLDSPQFIAASRLRKNLPALHLSYLASQGAERDAMKIAFPLHRPLLDFIDNLLQSFADTCYGVYVDAFIRRQFTIAVDEPIYQVLRKLHRKYKTTREKVTLTDVWTILAELPVKELDQLLQYHAQNLRQAS